MDFLRSSIRFSNKEIITSPPSTERISDLQISLWTSKFISNTTYIKHHSYQAQLISSTTHIKRNLYQTQLISNTNHIKHNSYQTQIKSNTTPSSNISSLAIIDAQIKWISSSIFPLTISSLSKSAHDTRD
jgi:hypothetical protein